MAVSRAGTASLSSGVATFSTLSVSTVGTGFKLVATDTADNLTAGWISNPFNVTRVPGTFTWTNTDGNNLWTDPNNWSVTPTTPPAGDPYPLSVDTAVFNTSGTVNLNGSQSVAAIDFNSGAAVTIAVTNSSDTLTVGTGSISLAAGAATTDSISAAVVLAGNETWTITTGDSLTVSGNISGSGYGLTEAGPAAR